MYNVAHWRTKSRFEINYKNENYPILLPIKIDFVKYNLLLLYVYYLREANLSLILLFIETTINRIVIQ